MVTKKVKKNDGKAKSPKAKISQTTLSPKNLANYLWLGIQAASAAVTLEPLAKQVFDQVVVLLSTNFITTMSLLTEDAQINNASRQIVLLHEVKKFLQKGTFPFLNNSVAVTLMAEDLCDFVQNGTPSSEGDSGKWLAALESRWVLEAVLSKKPPRKLPPLIVKI